MSGTAPAHFLADLTELARMRAQWAAQDVSLQEVNPQVEGRRHRLWTALTARRFAVIAESKERSPSAGRLEAGVYDPAARARLYEEAGAAAISVLTEPRFFGGALQHLEAARTASALPLLRKDFLLHPAQVAEAVRAGADAVLAIVRILTDQELQALLRAGDALGVDVLVEVHDEGELGRAVDVGARLIGVNNRDLDTFSTDVARSLALAPQVPKGVLTVSESGIRTMEEIRALADAGFRAVLVGEAVMTGGSGLVREVVRWAS
jgi:indole-3-glycerol phosphate synthase